MTRPRPDTRHLLRRTAALALIAAVVIFVGLPVAVLTFHPPALTAK